MHDVVVLFRLSIPRRHASIGPPIGRAILDFKILEKNMKRYYLNALTL